MTWPAPIRSAASPPRPPRRLRSDPLIPGWLWLPAVIGIVFLLLPIIGMLTRVDPQGLLAVITAEESRLAMKLSLLSSVTSALISVLIGFPLGYLLATRTFPGQRIVRTLILLPLVLPLRTVYACWALGLMIAVLLTFDPLRWRPRRPRKDSDARTP